MLASDLSSQLLLAVASARPERGAGTAESPFRAADDAQARRIISAWQGDRGIARRVCSAPIVYSEGETKLHGRKFWAAGEPPGRATPVVLLLHTAVGPHDLFLHWRAECLAALGYVAFVADMLGDERGDGWTRDWCEPRRAALVAYRDLSRARIGAAIDAACADTDDLGCPRVDRSRTAAIGFCFGGRAALDWARGDPDGLRGVVSFHGILDNSPLAPAASRVRADVLLCHGGDDPFVPDADVDACVEQLRGAGARVELRRFGGVRHAFTNPAQALNPNPAFGYDAAAAADSWDLATRFLRRVLDGDL